MTKEPQSLHLDYSIFELVEFYSQRCGTYYHRDYENSCLIVRDQKDYPFGESLAFDIVNTSEVIVGVVETTPTKIEKKFVCRISKIKLTNNNLMQLINTFKVSKGHIEYVKRLLETI